MAAKAATTTIPIVFAVGYDPVELGLVASLNRPGGNVTGMFVFGVSWARSAWRLLREVLPNPGLIACVVNPTRSNTWPNRGDASAAQAIGLQLMFCPPAAKGKSTRYSRPWRNAGGAVIVGPTVFSVVAIELVALAARHAIPRSINGATSSRPAA